mmetsp:Transcript_6651/g.18972  ORF Transcript_6651/g.18972 Transcript_6651/m.18972 type:complete len:104 (+) Transcript_6651:1807-2118(+)
MRNAVSPCAPSALTCAYSAWRPSSVVTDDGGGAAAAEPQVTVDADTGVRMDALGPIIINTDGTVARISNWAALTERERKVALKRIAKRNAQRREVLEARGAVA